MDGGRRYPCCGDPAHRQLTEQHQFHGGIKQGNHLQECAGSLRAIETGVEDHRCGTTRRVGLPEAHERFRVVAGKGIVEVNGLPRDVGAGDEEGAGVFTGSSDALVNLRFGHPEAGAYGVSEGTVALLRQQVSEPDHLDSCRQPLGSRQDGFDGSFLAEEKTAACRHHQAQRFGDGTLGVSEHFLMVGPHIGDHGMGGPYQVGFGCPQVFWLDCHRF